MKRKIHTLWGGGGSKKLENENFNTFVYRKISEPNKKNKKKK